MDTKNYGSFKKVSKKPSKNPIFLKTNGNFASFPNSGFDKLTTDRRRLNKMDSCLRRNDPAALKLRRAGVTNFGF
jgi:hypothetical protein